MPRERRRLLGLTLALGAGASLGWLARRFARAAPDPALPAGADAALAAWLASGLRDPQGQVLAPVWQGRPLLVNVWASWCGPCREEMPLLDQAARQHAPDGLIVLGLAWDDAATVVDFLQRVPVSYPLAMAGAGVDERLIALGNPQRGLPFSLFVHADGRIASQRLGAFRAPELAARLAAILPRMESR